MSLLGDIPANAYVPGSALSVGAASGNTAYGNIGLTNAWAWLYNASSSIGLAYAPVTGTYSVIAMFDMQYDDLTSSTSKQAGHLQGGLYSSYAGALIETVQFWMPYTTNTRLTTSVMWTGYVTGGNYFGLQATAHIASGASPGNNSAGNPRATATTNCGVVLAQVQ